MNMGSPSTDSGGFYIWDHNEGCRIAKPASFTDSTLFIFFSLSSLFGGASWHPAKVNNMGRAVRCSPRHRDRRSRSLDAWPLTFLGFSPSHIFMVQSIFLVKNRRGRKRAVIQHSTVLYSTYSSCSTEFGRTLWRKESA